MKKRSVTLKGHRTSVSLEPEFWTLLESFADADGVSLAKLIAGVDRARLRQETAPGLSSALRVYALNRLQKKD